LKKKRVKNQTPPLNAEEARAYAFLLLKFRLRSESELKFRLVRKGFSESLACATVDFLKEKKFIDDDLFARNWAVSRLKRPFGLVRIRRELAQKGVPEAVVRGALDQVKEGYREDKVVAQLAEKKFAQLKGVEPLKARARVYGYLMRRGFSPEVVGEAVSKL
jgi:regulatory protein